MHQQPDAALPFRSTEPKPGKPMAGPSRPWPRRHEPAVPSVPRPHRPDCCDESGRATLPASGRSALSALQQRQLPISQGIGPERIASAAHGSGTSCGHILNRPVHQAVNCRALDRTGSAQCGGCALKWWRCAIRLAPNANARNGRDAGGPREVGISPGRARTRVPSLA